MLSPWMNTEYHKLPSDMYKHFPLTVDGTKYIILINPDVGSWAALSENEFERYKNEKLDPHKMELLYMRALAVDDAHELIETDFPQPAEYPSVVVVNITTACNLHCRYCFADCEADGSYMQDDVMTALIRQMLQMPSPLITFEIQGGEPLCHLQGMRRFVEICTELNKCIGKKVKFRTVTNATLVDDEFIELAKQYDITVGISLDGPEEFTNKNRIDADGNGAFDRIIAGVNRLRDGGVDVDGVVCTVGSDSAKHGREIVNFFDKLGISFKPRPANILGREINNATTTKPGEWAQMYMDMYVASCSASVENYSIHIHEENVYTPIRDYICLRYPCGAAREVISVNPDGTVYPCDGFKGEAKFVMGNVLEESLEDMLQKPEVVKLKNRTHKDIPKCSECLFRGMCCSCCYSAYGAYGTVYREDPLCADRRKIFLFLMETWIRNNKETFA